MSQFTCSATPEQVEEHTKILATIPAMSNNIEKILKNQEEQFKRLNKNELDIAVIRAERKTERGILSILAGVIGALAGWFSKHL